MNWRGKLKLEAGVRVWVVHEGPATLVRRITTIDPRAGEELERWLVRIEDREFETLVHRNDILLDGDPLDFIHRDER